MESNKCDEDVFKNGTSLGIFDMSKSEAEKFCADKTKETGIKHDWHYVMGRVHVKALYPTELLKAIAQRDELLAALNNLVDIIDKAGLGNLSKGVQLGAMSWYVKASDAVEWAREAIAKCEVKS